MNFNKIFAAFAAILLMCVGSLTAVAQETVQDNTVRIKVGTSYGSGCYVGDKLVLSCAHLYNDENTQFTEVWFQDGKHFTGKLLKIDTNWDQSLIGLDTQPSKLGIPISTENPKPGEHVYAYGYGKSNKIQTTSGYVQQYLGSMKDTSASDWFSLSGTVQEGSSGGPIVNAEGYIIGNLWGTDGVRTVGLLTGRTKRFLLPWNNRLSRGVCRGQICYPPGYNQPQPQPQQPSSGLVPLPSDKLQPLPTPEKPLNNQPDCKCGSQYQTDPTKGC